MRLLLCAKFTSLSVCSVLAVHICCTFSKFSFICLLKHLLFTFPNCSLCLQALTKTTDKIVFEYRQYIHVIQKSQSSIKCVSWNFIYTHYSLLTLLLFPNTRCFLLLFPFFIMAFFCCIHVPPLWICYFILHHSPSLSSLQTLPYMSMQSISDSYSL